jgi:two-component system, NarL family, nitrate/nitrite response regulator NarL
VPTLEIGARSAGASPATPLGLSHELVWRSSSSRLRHDRQNTVVLLDERQLIVEALAALLTNTGRFAVTTCAPDDAAATTIASLRPDFVLVGAGHRHERCLQLVESLHELAPEVRTVIVADSQEPALIRSVLDQTAAALVMSNVTGEDLAIMLDQVLRGNAALPAGWQSVLAEAAHNPVSSLSCRQLEVLRLLADGCSYEEISSRLVITVNTVKFHVRSIYLGLGVSNRMAATRVLEASLGTHTAHPIS